MATSPEPKNDIVFLGFNFNNFFKTCGCVKRTDEVDELYSDKEDNKFLIKPEQRVKQGQDSLQSPRKGNEDAVSIASSTDWTDLEEIPLPNDLNMRSSAGVQASNAVPNGNEEVYYTQEPIDFEFLKQVTGTNKDDDDAKSGRSGLSKSSKKISKELAGATDTKNNGKVKSTKNDAKGKRNPWQPHEDAKVLELVAKYGQSWAVVASMMEGRTGKQIRDRYLNKLRPNIRRGDWTPEEDRLLLNLYYQMGHKWSKIATYLPGRTEGQVKNRFYSHIKKKILGMESSDQFSGLESPHSNFSGTYQGLPKVLPNDVPRNSAPMDMFQDYRAKPHFVETSPSRFVGNGDEHAKALLSPSGSTGTATTQESRVFSDKEVNNILDKLAGYLEKNTDGTTEPQQSYGTMFPQNPQNLQNPQNGNMQLAERMQQLQQRRNKLQFLLDQTLRDLNTFTPSQNGGFHHGYNGI